MFVASHAHAELRLGELRAFATVERAKEMMAARGKRIPVLGPAARPIAQLRA
jgi:hypothetical protein